MSCDGEVSDNSAMGSFYCPCKTERKAGKVYRSMEQVHKSNGL